MKKYFINKFIFVLFLIFYCTHINSEELKKCFNIYPIANTTLQKAEQLDFRGKYLAFNVFLDLDLRNADFTGANLNYAKFINCNLKDAKFVGTELNGTKFIKCSFIWYTDFSKSFYSLDSQPVIEK